MRGIARGQPDVIAGHGERAGSSCGIAGQADGGGHIVAVAILCSPAGEVIAALGGRDSGGCLRLAHLGSAGCRGVIPTGGRWVRGVVVNVEGAQLVVDTQHVGDRGPVDGGGGADGDAGRVVRIGAIGLGRVVLVARDGLAPVLIAGAGRRGGRRDDIARLRGLAGVVVARVRVRVGAVQLLQPVLDRVGLLVGVQPEVVGGGVVESGAGVLRSSQGAVCSDYGSAGLRTRYHAGARICGVGSRSRPASQGARVLMMQLVAGGGHTRRLDAHQTRARHFADGQRDRGAGLDARRQRDTRRHRAGAGDRVGDRHRVLGPLGIHGDARVGAVALVGI